MLAESRRLFLAAVNIIGIRESAILSLVMAAAALVVDMVVIGVTLISLGPPEWDALTRHLRYAESLSWRDVLGRIFRGVAGVFWAGKY